MEKKEICHVCKKEKKPYTLFIKNNILSFIMYEQARKDGNICERCNSYFGMTSEFKDATEEEFKNAKKSVWFAKMMLKWWERENKLVVIDDKDNPILTDIRETRLKNKRCWDGTETIAKWCRELLNKKMK